MICFTQSYEIIDTSVLLYLSVGVQCNHIVKLHRCNNYDSSVTRFLYPPSTAISFDSVVYIQGQAWQQPDLDV